MSPVNNMDFLARVHLKTTLILMHCDLLLRLSLLGELGIDLGTHLGNGLLGVGRSKDRGTRHKNVGSSLGALARISGTHTAVDLDVLLGETSAELGALGQALGHELLAAEARADSHDEEHLNGVAELVGDDG